MLAGCQSQTENTKPTNTASFKSMESTIYVSPQNALPIVQEVFTRVDKELSEWKSESLLSEVNKNAGIKAVTCHTDVIAAVQLSLQIAKQTNGLFDPTWASMWELWDFDIAIVPAKQEITSRLSLVNWEQVEVTNDTIQLTEVGMMLGLGGIAKGIALNQAREALLNKGINDFMIVSGGQVLANGEPKAIGIRTPDGLPDDIIAIAELKDASISTSGDYEKYFEVEGVRYHHIIDPRTGFPANSGVRSVSVISTNAAVADAFSTALFVMGVDQGLALVEQTDNLEAYYIEDGKTVTQSSGFKASQSASKTYP